MQHEAKMLRKANSIGVGPRLLDVSTNFLLMQFIDGVLLPKWLEKRREKGLVKNVLREILEQCWRLDEAHLDHGELSHAPKHIIIDKNGTPITVDFETASINRKPANITSICHFLFIGGSVAKKVTEKLGKKNEKAMIEVLRRYKNDRTHGNFEKVLKACGVYTT
jgi:putative serine/threonine protein kinase